RGRRPVFCASADYFYFAASLLFSKALSNALSAKTILTCLRSLAASSLALHLSQQKETLKFPTFTDVAGFNASPDSRHLVCLYCPVETSCILALVANFLVFASNAFGQLSQQK